MGGAVWKSAMACPRLSACSRQREAGPVGLALALQRSRPLHARQSQARGCCAASRECSGCYHLVTTPRPVGACLTQLGAAHEVSGVQAQLRQPQLDGLQGGAGREPSRCLACETPGTQQALLRAHEREASSTQESVHAHRGCCCGKKAAAG